MDLNRSLPDHQLALIRTAVATICRIREEHQAHVKRIARLIVQDRGRSIEGGVTTIDPSFPGHRDLPGTC